MTSKINISSTALFHLLNLIGDCDNNMTVLRQTGETETGLLMRQERHLKNKYCNDLNLLLEKAKLHIKVIEI
jgi:hypothetical protein